MNFKGTPGPHEIWNKDESVIAGKTRYIARFGVPNQVEDEEESANIQLFAAALEMAQVLSDVETWLVLNKRDGSIIMPRIRDVLKKAGVS